jgi:hypothetical protein
VVPLLVVTVALAQGGQLDTAVYHDVATAGLVMRAAERHARQVSRLDRFSARVRTHVEASLAAAKFAPGIPLVRMDLAAAVQWQRPAARGANPCRSPPRCQAREARGLVDWSHHR